MSAVETGNTEMFAVETGNQLILLPFNYDYTAVNTELITRTSSNYCGLITATTTLRTELITFVSTYQHRANGRKP